MDSERVHITRAVVVENEELTDDDGYRFKNLCGPEKFKPELLSFVLCFMM